MSAFRTKFCQGDDTGARAASSELTLKMAPQGQAESTRGAYVGVLGPGLLGDWEREGEIAPIGAIEALRPAVLSRITNDYSGRCPGTTLSTPSRHLRRRRGRWPAHYLVIEPRHRPSAMLEGLDPATFIKRD